MKSLFSGLDAFGMDDIDKVEVFEVAPEVKEAPIVPTEKTPKSIEALLYDRSIKCPVCNNKFDARTIKIGVNKFVSTTLNLRPIYTDIDPILYDVILCERCGYSALNRNFTKVSERQIKEFKVKVATKFKSRTYPEIYTNEIALERYKMALYTAVVIGSNDVNKAYLCLKTSWIIDGRISESMDEKVIEGYRQDRLSFIEHAYKGFSKAYGTTVFPVFGMNEATYHYLLGVLAFELGDVKHTSLWLGKVLLSQNVNRRLKEKAREVKDLIETNSNKKDE
jgi:uncharacterized protein (DUF2225 family)